MNVKKVIFIAHQNQENLGVGYLSSMLLSHGFDVETVDFGLDKVEICKQVKEADPLIVGFSLIFQYHFPMLRELAKHLRENGINCHFTVGGHYPSLGFGDILDKAPEIDSVVRFEGELTIYDLVSCLCTNSEWRKVRGIAYRKDGKPISNKLRPLISDLDSLPFPQRTRKRRFQCMQKDCAFILASRGCVRNCSFCSVRKFYQTPPGKLRRSRSPANVVDEMKELYDKHLTRIFLFQDDDFFLPGKHRRKWIIDFIHELESSGLANKILWKINCRPDEVDSELFRDLKNVGLEMIYLGIESGNPTGLELLNKGLEVEDSIRAVEILKKLKMLFEFGFMLFDPSSTFDSLRTNICFLRKICGDGNAPVVFGKMIPYAETDIEKRLLREGRLKGGVSNPDYDFFDPRLDRLYEFLHLLFREWMFSPTGLLAKLRWHRFEILVLKKFYPSAREVPEYEDFQRGIIASSNSLFFDIVTNAATIFEESGYDLKDQLRELILFQHLELEKITSKRYESMVEFQRQQ